MYIPKSICPYTHIYLCAPARARAHNPLWTHSPPLHSHLTSQDAPVRPSSNAEALHASTNAATTGHPGNQPAINTTHTDTPSQNISQPLSPPGNRRQTSCWEAALLGKPPAASSSKNRARHSAHAAGSTPKPCLHRPACIPSAHTVAQGGEELQAGLHPLSSHHLAQSAVNDVAPLHRNG